MEEKRILRSLCAGVFVLICSCVFAANPTVVLYQAAILEADRGNIIGAEADLRHAIDLIRSPSQKATFLFKLLNCMKMPEITIALWKFTKSWHSTKEAMKAVIGSVWSSQNSADHR